MTNVTLSLDSYQEQDIEKLIYYGNEIVNNNRETIRTLIATIVDQKVADGTIVVPFNVTCPQQPVLLIDEQQKIPEL